MARKDVQMDRFGEVLSNSLKRLELSPRLDQYRVWPIWNEVVGKTIANNAQPQKIRNGTLSVKVTSPVWMHQLQFMKEMIAEKLNERLESDLVKTIFFIVGNIEAPPNDMTPETNKTDAPHPPRVVDEDFLQSIDDPEIRDAFTKLLKSFARRKPKN